MCYCLSSSVHEVCEEEFDLSKEDVDSIISLCEEQIFEADLFELRGEIWSSMMGIEAEIESLNESKINKIKRDNEKVWEKLDDLLTNLKLFQYREEKYRFVSNLFDQELELGKIIAEIDGSIYTVGTDHDPLILKKNSSKNDLLEELLKNITNK